MTDDPSFPKLEGERGGKMKRRRKKRRDRRRGLRATEKVETRPGSFEYMLVIR